MKRVIVVILLSAFTLTMSAEGGNWRFQYIFLEALRMMHKNEHVGAFDLLQECERMDSTSAEVKYLLGYYYHELGNDSLAQRYTERAAELSPKNARYREQQATYALKQNNYEKGIAILDQIYNDDHERGDILEAISSIAEHTGNYEKAIEALDKLETLEGKTEQISLKKYHLYMQNQKYEEALHELDALSEKYPNDLDYRVMKGDYFMVQEERQKALGIYNEVLKQEPENLQAQMSMYKYLDNVNDTVQKDTFLVRMLCNSTITGETRLYIARMAVGEYEKMGRDSTYMLSIFRKVLEQPQQDQMMTLFYALYMENINMPTDSVTPVLRQILEKEPENVEVRSHLIENAWNANDYENVVTLSQEARQYNPEDIRFYYFEGLAHAIKKETDKAVDILKRGQTTIKGNANPELASVYYSLLGDCYHEKGLMRQAYEAYDSCLKWNPENVSCLNNYAYFLSLEEKDLEKAEQMSFKTIIAEPSNATFLDTYAWILYQQQNLEGAKKYIDRTLLAIDSTNIDATVYEHAGDIYIMLDNQHSAIEYWTQALDVLKMIESDRIKDEERKATEKRLLRKIKRAGGKIKEDK